MLNIQNSPRTFWVTFLGTTIPVSMLAFYQAVPQLISQGIAPWQSKWTIILMALLLNIAIGGLAIRNLTSGSYKAILERIETASFSGPARAAVFMIIFLAPAFFWLIRFKVFGSILPQLFPAVWIFLWLSLVSALALKLTMKVSLATSFIAVILFQGVLFRVWSIFGAVTDFPFTLEYSETSRFYYASLPFSESLYNMALPLSILHPSRYLLQSIPFIIPDLPLWAHRFWQALLWMILTGVSSSLLARRMNLSNKYLSVLIMAWGFIYFLQGAVYYHLQVCVIIILLGVSIKRPWQTLLVVILSSLWAGISRVNWFPVPAMLAIALYLLEQPVSSSKNLWHYLRYPVIWTVVGLLSAFTSQVLYVFWSGNQSNPNDFASSFTSDLIWSRLLPNITYPLGVLPAILLVSTPLFIVLIYMLNGNRSRWHMIRPIGLFSMLAVLFIGGLIVSTKIGGGADMHNMDAFIVLLAVVVCSFFAGQVSAENNGSLGGTVSVWVIMFAALIPAVFALQGVQPHFTYDKEQAQKDFATLRTALTDATRQGGEILFISERHMVTFHMLDNVALVPDYEVVTLMEMAMSGNQAYLGQFYADLASHRFAAIVTRKQRVVKKEDEPFAEENNVWIDAISRPLLCYYERGITLDSSNTLILLPVQAKENCP